jgi:hypothetical protein
MSRSIDVTVRISAEARIGLGSTVGLGLAAAGATPSSTSSVLRYAFSSDILCSKSATCVSLLAVPGGAAAWSLAMVSNA